MTQLIAQQAVKKRRSHDRRPKTVKIDTYRLDGLAILLTTIGKKLQALAKPRYLYIAGAAVAVPLLMLVTSSVVGNQRGGMGGGLGMLPRDAGIDSLLDSYLSPGKGPEVEGQAIVPSGNVLMSYTPRTYIVEPGDTVSAIAQKYNLNMSTIISLNGITDVRRLWAGVELKIPPVDGVLHIVKGNESLSSIAGNYGVDLEPLLDINNINSDVIHEGDRLFVPDGEMSYVAYHTALGDLFVWPVRGPLSSGFEWRDDPFTGVRSMHRGYDIVARGGTAVKASNQGRIIYTGENNLYGKYILIQHVDRYQTLYAHLSRITVSENQRVALRQKIGEVGNTGRSTGPHLHFSIYYNGDALDPGRFLNNY